MCVCVGGGGVKQENAFLETGGGSVLLLAPSLTLESRSLLFPRPAGPSLLLFKKRHSADPWPPELDACGGERAAPHWVIELKELPRTHPNKWWSLWGLPPRLISRNRLMLKGTRLPRRSSTCCTFYTPVHTPLSCGRK